MKKYDQRKIRSKTCYDPTEVSLLLNVHKETLYRWGKKGLNLLDPTGNQWLVMGQDLKDFLHKAYEEKRVKLTTDEVFCVACKKAVKIKDGTRQIKETGKKIGRNDKSLKRICGQCSKCGREISRFLK